jgi:hypothetical protein
MLVSATHFQRLRFAFGTILALLPGFACRSAEDTSGPSSMTCGERELDESEFIAIEHVPAGRLGSARGGAREPELSINEPLAMDAVLLLSAATGRNITYEGMTFEELEGIRVAVVDPDAPYRDDGMGGCELNEVEGGLSQADATLNTPLDYFAEAPCTVIFSDGTYFKEHENAGLLGASISPAVQGTYYCASLPLTLITPEDRDAAISEIKTLLAKQGKLLDAVHDGPSEDLHSRLLALILGVLGATFVIACAAFLVLMLKNVNATKFSPWEQATGLRIRNYERRTAIRHWFFAKALSRLHDRTGVQALGRLAERYTDKWRSVAASSIAPDLARDDSERLEEIMGAILYKDRIVIVEDPQLGQARVLRHRDFRHAQLESAIWWLPTLGTAAAGTVALYVFGWWTAAVWTLFLLGWLALPRFELRRISVATQDGILISLRMPIEHWAILRSWMNGTLSAVLGGEERTGGDEATQAPVAEVTYSELSVAASKPLVYRTFVNMYSYFTESGDRDIPENGKAAASNSASLELVRNDIEPDGNGPDDDE